MARLRGGKLQVNRDAAQNCSARRRL